LPVSSGRSVAVVAVTHAPAESLPAFLESLRSATGGPVDVVVASQGEPGALVQAAADREDVRLVDATGFGYGRAVNRGVHDTTEEFVAIASPEIVWEPGSLDALLDAAERWPSGAAFGPLIHTAGGGVYPSARSVPSLRNGIGHALFGWWWPGNPWTRAYRHARDIPAERTAGWLVGTCLLIRRDAFDEVGGFDADRLVYLEDLDLGERFVKAGWHNVYVPSAVVSGSVRQEGETDAAKLAADQHRSVWSYLSRRYSGWRWLPVRLALRAGLGVRAMLAKRVRRMARGPAPRG
jgi:N-acetylglucosaminyl-diphospho-decaprenol L-rhamnosyltransferase